MKKNKIPRTRIIFLLSVVIALFVYGFYDIDRLGGSSLSKSSSTSQLAKSYDDGPGGKKGDSYRLWVNNINLPLNSKGIIANVNPGDLPLSDPNGGEGGKFGNITFLFSSGFFLSGRYGDRVFANAVASASLVEDYVPGTASTSDNAVIYVVTAEDEPFGNAWLDWKDAVKLGADFYDGDGDGIYNPVDLNGNGIWDPNEDRPDLIGDATVWCVYTDGVPAAQRTYKTENPIGIEMRQTVFAFSSAGPVGNIVFVRYRIKYAGLGLAGEPDTLKDVYFGVWADPDMGDHTDDLVGCDIERNAGFLYNSGTDSEYGVNPPTFLIDFFSGPVNYIAGETYIDNNQNGIYDEGIDTPLDTAYRIRGEVMGVDTLPGAKNLGLSSFMHYINGDPDLDDPGNAREARYYMEGLSRKGEFIDPCDWAYGAVRGGVNCATVNPRFLYSGDPVANTGWINITPSDQRMLQNTGPFTLKKGVENEIVVAYIVGQGTSALNSVDIAKQYSDGAQFIFDNNFVAPTPAGPVNVKVKTDDETIDLIWETPKHVSYKNKTDAYDLHFQGFLVYAFKTSSTVETINNQPNKKLIAHYSLDNFIQKIYMEDLLTGGQEIIYDESNNKLNKNFYEDPVTGKIRLRITRDPFDDQTPVDIITKGKPYYFAVVTYSLNYEALYYRDDPSLPLGTVGDYVLSASKFVAEVEDIPRIITSYVGDGNQPLTYDGIQMSGNSKGKLKIDLLDPASITGDKYEISFFVDSTNVTTYKPFWRLTNLSTTTNKIRIDSALSYAANSTSIFDLGADGFIIRLTDEVPRFSAFVKNTQNEWYDTAATKFFYLPGDVPNTNRPNIPVLGTSRNTVTKADRIRRVELKFGTSNAGKAYRYLNGYRGANIILKRNSYIYAEAIVPADTMGRGKIGLWDTINDRPQGFVDVPFTAWVEDPTYGEKRQLAVGFIERSSADGGNPDGVWNPGTSLGSTFEYILIFDADYDPNGNQRIYKGFSDGSTITYADLRGGNNYRIPDGAMGVTAEEKKIANSPYLNAIYAIGTQKKDASIGWAEGDRFIINPSIYPYTTEDKFEFQTIKGGLLSEEQEKERFEKVNVFPNPLFGFNPYTSYENRNPDEPFVTFSNLPEEVTIKIFSLSGQLLNTLTSLDKKSFGSSYLNWYLKNESGLRVASGIYLAIVSSPKYGDKVLKFSIIMPQKQLPRY